MFEEEIKAVMKDFNPVPVLGRNWSHVGDYVLYITDFEEIMVNVSDYSQNLTTTTENPNPGKHLLCHKLQSARSSLLFNT